MYKVLKRIIIAECIMLAACIVLARWIIFPLIAGKSMLHVQVAMHIFMIGICATIFSLVAISIKRKWKTHGMYILIPVIFTVFGYLMQIISGEIFVP